MAESSEKVASIAARILDGSSYTDADVKRLAGSVLRQKEKRTLKRAIAAATRANAQD